MVSNGVGGHFLFGIKDQNFQADYTIFKEHFGKTLVVTGVVSFALQAFLEVFGGVTYSRKHQSEQRRHQARSGCLVVSPGNFSSMTFVAIQPFLKFSKSFVLHKFVIWNSNEIFWLKGNSHCNCTGAAGAIPSLQFFLYNV